MLTQCSRGALCVHVSPDRRGVGHCGLCFWLAKADFDGAVTNAVIQGMKVVFGTQGIVETLKVDKGTLAVGKDTHVVDSTVRGKNAGQVGGRQRRIDIAEPK